jgi:hypothetical protein
MKCLANPSYPGHLRHARHQKYETRVFLTGFTLMIPLLNITTDLGRDESIPTSHHLATFHFLHHRFINCLSTGLLSSDNGSSTRSIPD